MRPQANLPLRPLHRLRKSLRLMRNHRLRRLMRLLPDQCRNPNRQPRLIPGLMIQRLNQHSFLSRQPIWALHSAA